MTKKDRLEIYEAFFHQFQMHIMMHNDKKITEGLRLIDSWSYAHRSGNGECSDYEQKKKVEHVIARMKDFI
jgi:hypothetical protein